MPKRFTAEKRHVAVSSLKLQKLAQRTEDARRIGIIDGDRRYWEKLARSLGWRLFGFTDRFHATFITGPNQTLSLSSHQRDAIVDRLQELSGAPIQLPNCLTCGDEKDIVCSVCAPKSRRKR